MENQTAPAATENQNGPMLAVQSVYLKDCSYEAPKGPRIDGNWSPQISLDINTTANVVAPEVNEVVLTVTVGAKQGEATAFLVEVKQAGLFVMRGLNPDDTRRAIGTDLPERAVPVRARRGVAARDAGRLPEFRAAAGRLRPAVRARPRSRRQAQAAQGGRRTDARGAAAFADRRASHVSQPSSTISRTNPSPCSAPVPGARRSRSSSRAPVIRRACGAATRPTRSRCAPSGRTPLSARREVSRRDRGARRSRGGGARRGRHHHRGSQPLVARAAHAAEAAAGARCAARVGDQGLRARHRQTTAPGGVRSARRPLSGGRAVGADVRARSRHGPADRDDHRLARRGLRRPAREEPARLQLPRLHLHRHRRRRSRRRGEERARGGRRAFRRTWASARTRASR